MTPRLLTLIRAFQAAAADALETFLARAGLAHPFGWREAGLLRSGILSGEPPIRYSFHGAGLALSLGSEHIDFDFGHDGRTGGFNDWWLTPFAAEHREQFPEFADGRHIRTALEAALAVGEIGQPFRGQQDGLYHLLRADGALADPTTGRCGPSAATGASGGNHDQSGEA